MNAQDHVRLIWIVRRPGELVALTSEPASKDPSSFAVKSTPLDLVSRSLFPEKPRLQESWRRLANVKAADANTLYDVMLVAIESVPDLSVVPTLLPLPNDWGEAPRSPKATSAHPRAFKGTKHRPPKNASPAALDIRGHLCHPGAIQALASRMRK